MHTVKKHQPSSALTMVGRQAGHPVACKNLYPLIIHCYDAVGWERNGIPHVEKFQHPLLSRLQLANPGKWSLKWRVLCRADNFYNTV